MATNASLSGPMLRGSGIAWDIRKADPYCGYEKYDFDIPIGYQGDCLRPLHRPPRRDAPEPEDHPAGARWPARAARTAPQVPLALRPPQGEAYARVESPRGELGYYLVSDEGPSPYRFHIRPPSFINLSARSGR